MTPNHAVTETPGPHVCPHQIAFFLDNWFRRLIQHPTKVVGPYIREGDTVIDMGCGPGYFTIDMAKMVGPKGRVIAVDIQEKMLQHVRKKARKHDVEQRIEYFLAGAHQSGLDRQADFILAFYMIHETPDVKQTLVGFERLIRENGKILAVEPKMHVSQSAFEDMIQTAQAVGLTVLEYPKGKGGRSVVFEKSRSSL
jgi:ubiquinone/menaquinone biosynthesis C-methylase UbiE